MSVAHAEHASQNASEKEIIHEIPLSNYAKSLASVVQKRYIDKISCIGVDPLLIPDEKLSTECLPPVEAVDLVSYLVLQTSFYTKDQFKNFKSLQAYNQMVSGFVTSVLGQILVDKYIVVAKVRHSQRMNEPPVKLWLIITKEGGILSAHCQGCMAGLGECCSHVASILFYLEVSARLNEKLACTQVKCSWILPATIKNVEYLRVKDIDFSSAKKMKYDLDKSIDSLDPENDNVTAAEFSGTSTPVSQKRKFSLINIKPSLEDLDDFYKTLSECKIKPVCLSLVHPYADTFISETRDISSILDLFDPKFLELNYIDLLKECHHVKLNITREQVKLIERSTVEQSKGNAFFRHRSGRIGASKCYAATNTNPAQPSQSLIKSICYPHVFRFSTAATIHGCKHEDIAIKAYTTYMKQKHLNFQVNKCGTFIDPDSPFLHATPDFLCECECCGLGCGEVKCPYCIEGLDFEKYCEQKSCLQPDGEKFVLKREHAYYYQVQQQLNITKRAYCDFVVYATSPNGSKIFQERILPNPEHWATQLTKLSVFWRNCVLPEVLGRWYTRKMDLKKELGSVSGTGDCYCRRTSDERTVSCSNPECPISVFHLACLFITNVPKTWLCPHCRKLPKFIRSSKGAKKLDRPNFCKEALLLDTICLCKGKAKDGDKLLKCHNESCSSGKFFHLSCLSYKRYPNNYKLSWLCNKCKLESIVTKKSLKPFKEPSVSTANISFHDDDSDIVYLGSNENVDIDKYGKIATLSAHDFDLIESPTGWLENTIIQYAQVLLRKVNPALSGFQRTSLGVYLNFDKVDGDFVQILHAGGNHWVCTSSIGCEKGFVNVYDSLFHDAIVNDIKQQVQNIVGDDFKDILVVPVQQQLNGSDCGVFAIAFATTLVYTLDTNIPQFDVPQMRSHLSTCLKAGLITPFPVAV